MHALQVDVSGERGVLILRTFGHLPEAGELKRDLKKKVRRWIVEVAHSWFNRFRKLLARYEKLDLSFLALNHLAAAILAFRKIKRKGNITCGLSFRWEPLICF